MASSTDLSLPSEVILHIAEYCDKNTILALSRTSKRLHSLLQEAIWRTLVFTAADFELHMQSKDPQPADEAPARHDVLTYFLGGCAKNLCDVSFSGQGETVPTQQKPNSAVPCAPQWQVELVKELVFDFWQWHDERPDRQWAHDRANDSICMKLIECFPNARRIGWRSHAIPLAVTGQSSTLSEAHLKSLEFCFDPLHPALPSVWKLDDSHLKAIRPDPTQFTDLTFCKITHLKIAELHPCLCPFLAYSVRRMPLLSLALSVDSGAYGLLMDPLKEQFKIKGEDLKSAWHPMYQLSAIRLFLYELTTPTKGVTSDAQAMKFPATLETLILKETDKAEDVDLDLLAMALMPCKDLKSLKLIGFPAGSIAQVLGDIRVLCGESLPDALP